MQVKGKVGYYSEHCPTVSVDGVERAVVFGKHAIDRISDRLNPRWINSYAALGDVFAWLAQTVFFELARLTDGRHAISFFDICDDPDYVPFRYVRAILGKEFQPQSGLRPYRRLGYCPLMLNGEFAIGLTFLLPGYRQTPEHSLIERADLSQAERKMLLDIAEEDPVLDSAPPDRSFLPLKYRHERGISQIIETDRVMMREAFTDQEVVIWKPL